MDNVDRILSFIDESNNEPETQEETKQDNTTTEQ